MANRGDLVSAGFPIKNIDSKYFIILLDEIEIENEKENQSASS